MPHQCQQPRTLAHKWSFLRPPERKKKKISERVQVGLAVIISQAIIKLLLVFVWHNTYIWICTHIEHAHTPMHTNSNIKCHIFTSKISSNLSCKHVKEPTTIQQCIVDNLISWIGNWIKLQIIQIKTFSMTRVRKIFPQIFFSSKAGCHDVQVKLLTSWNKTTKGWHPILKCDLAGGWLDLYSLVLAGHSEP